jgi:nitrate/nitrite transporter NarK
MQKIFEFLGGRKMTIFSIMFLVITILFLFNYKVDEYADALYPYVLALVIGNVGEHFAKK